MGGKGSGRPAKPDLQTQRNYAKFEATENIELPNLGGVKDNVQHNVTTDDLSEGSINLYDKEVTLTEGANVTITGTYPDFTIASTDTDTTYTAGTGLSLDGTEFNCDITPDVYVSNEGLVLEMNFNSESVDSTYAYDASEGKNHGTITGATHNATGGFNGGGYFSFDGSNDAIDCPNIEMSAYTEITVSCWFRTDSVTSSSRLVSKDQGGTPGNWMLFNVSGTTWKFQAYDDNLGNWQKAEYASQAEEDGEWHHIVGVVSQTDNKIYLYMDGELKAQDDFTDATLDDSDNEIITIGADSDTGTKAQVWDGDIDDVRIYNRALTATEIENLYNTKQECRDINRNSKVQYKSIAPPEFQPYEPDTDDVSISTGLAVAHENSKLFYAPVNLPDGATIKEVKAWGNDTGNNWTLYRTNLNSLSTSNMASASIDSADTTISNSVVDNENYAYVLYIPCDSSDQIHGARIKYIP